MIILHKIITNLIIIFLIFTKIVFPNVIISDNYKNYTNFNDEYLLKNQKDCFKSHKILSCFKFKTGKFLWSIAINHFQYFQYENVESIKNYNENNLVKFIQLKEPSKMELFTDARSSKSK